MAGNGTIAVLVVDDEEVFRRTTARTLAQRGYSCVEAANSDEARVVLDTRPDIVAVLCDITMPGRSGIDLLRDVTADFPDLAVVMTTGADDPDVAEAAFDLGADGYLIKPFGVNELVISLAGAIRRRQLESERRLQMRSLEQTISRTKALGGLVERLEDGDDARGAHEGDLIDRLSRAVSLRDEETGRHLERMSRYSVAVAAATGFTGMSLEDLRLATALHDVGKIGVPDGILLKPGSLSSEEYTAMQRHAQVGYQLLAGSSSRLMHIAADIALTHHEWWDGGGYPRGLHGEEIPEAARIAAVTDVFDALTSHRVYRPAMPFAVATAIMSDLRGRQFEPRVLEAFLDSLDQMVEIRENYPDVDDAHRRIRILVVDDHEIFAHSLVRLLETKPELKVVGTAGTVAQAVSAAIAYEPEVILMDFTLPDGDGPQATEQIKALIPKAKIIMLTARTDDEAMVRAIAAGCAGFVRKEDAVELLFAAIVAAHEGETFTQTGDVAPLLRQLRHTHRGLGSDISRRELEVLELMAAGSVNTEIAERLRLQADTVENHVQNVLFKLQAHSTLEAVATAVREGVIEVGGATRSA